MPAHIGMRILPFALASVSLCGCADFLGEPKLPPRAIGVPPGWQGAVGSPAAYEIGLDRVEHHGGRSSAYITGPRFITPDFGVFSQAVRADNYRGKRVRLSAWVKGRGLVGPVAGLWMRVDGAGVVTGYDNMGNRAEIGTTDWHEVSIVLDVPSDALGIIIGAMRQGGGTLFIDDMKLEPVATSVPSTNMFDAPRTNFIDPAATIAAYLNAPASPTNIDFERTP
jgi:hypothetical protein